MSRVRGFYREPSAVFWTFGFPIMLSVALGIAFRNRPPEPASVAGERRPSAEALLAVLERDKGVRASLFEPAAAELALRTGKVALVVVPGTPATPGLPGQPDAPATLRTYRFDPTRPES